VKGNQEKDKIGSKPDKNRKRGTSGRDDGRTGGRSSDQGNGKIDGQVVQVGDQCSKVNDGVDGVPDFSTIITLQLRNLLPTIVAQVGNQGRGQGNGRNQNGDAINDNIRGDVRNIIENNDRRVSTYKEFLACNPKEYDGKGGVALTWWNSPIHTLGREVAVGMSWDNFKVLMREEFCRSNEIQKLENKLLTTENRRIERYVYGPAPQIQGMVAATEPSTIQKAMQIAGTLTDKALRNGSIKKNLEKRGTGGEPRKDRNGRDDNNRTRSVNAFATTAHPVRREYTGIDNDIYSTVDACPNACEMWKEIERQHVLGLNQALRPGGNHQVMAVNEGQNHRNNGNQARERAFMLGVEEARQDSNIVTGIEPSDLGFSYEIMIASGQLVEIDKVIKGCKLEKEGHMFDINFIPFGSESFDVIIVMDWLSNHKAKIIFHKKVVRMPLPNNKLLRVIGERPKEKMRYLVSAKAKKQKREGLVVARIRRIFLDGYGVLVVRIVIFKISSFKLQNARLLLIFTKVFETYKNVKQEIRDQLNAEAEAVRIILTGIDNDIYSTVDAYENPICTLGDYSKPSHKGYRNTIELPVGNNVEIIENLALYDHEGCNDTKEFVKPVKAISTPQSTLKTPNRRLFELEDQINFLLKGSQPTPRISTHIPHSYADAVYSNPHLQYQNESPKLNPFTFCKCTGPSPQPQALGTTFGARVWDYMAAHTKRMERFENSIYKKRDEINVRMTQMFGLLKELTTSRTPEKVLIREEAKFLVIKNVKYISLARGEEEKSDKIDVATGNDIEKPTEQK
nr:hypothetical protein [Tanacetum cinerariifolium]